MMRGILAAAGAAVVGGAVAKVALRGPAARPADTPLASLVLPAGVVVREEPGRRPGPLVVALHGANDNEAQLVPYLASVDAHKIYVRGFLPAGKGFQWLKSRIRKTPEPEFLRELEATGARLALLVRSMQAQRGAPSVVVAGFSQGGHLAWYLAARGVVDGAAIASGALPPSFAVSRPSRTVLLRYVSGVEDKTVPWETVRETSRRFKDSGYDVQGRQLKAGHSLAGMGYNFSQLLDEVVVRLMDLGR